MIMLGHDVGILHGFIARQLSEIASA